jgi:hypothetical protein
MNQDKVARREILTLQHKQAYFALYATRFAEALEIINRFDLHGDGKAHSLPLSVALSAWPKLQPRTNHSRDL